LFIMPYRSTMALAVPALVAATGLTVPSLLRAQAAATRRISPTALELGALSRERAYRWVAAAPVVRCGPAPLTEHPAAAAEMGRPHVAPLEATYLDAANAKRTLARVIPVAGS
jgi:choline dehydrogenase-like flavoprotein